MGEYLVGAYLKEIDNCEIVDYNERKQGGGRSGQNELDVIGFNFKNSEVYLCEVATHIDRLWYGSSTEETIDRINKKFKIQQDYYNTILKGKFNQAHFMLWAPKASENILKGLGDCKNLKLVVNGEYTKRVNKLIEKSKKGSNITGNPAYRLLQIISKMTELDKK